MVNLLSFFLTPVAYCNINMYYVNNILVVAEQYYVNNIDFVIILVERYYVPTKF